MTYTAADVARMGGVAWVRSLATRMDPNGIDSQIRGYAAAQAVLQDAAASTAKGRSALSQSWSGDAAHAAQQQFTMAANMHTMTAETIQQVMDGLSYTSSGMGSFIQTVLGPGHRPGQEPDPKAGLPLEVPVSLLTDPASTIGAFQDHQNAMAQNLKVRQQAADALNELVSTYGTAQTYFNAVTNPFANEGIRASTASYNLGSAPRSPGKGVAAVHSPIVRGVSTASRAAALPPRAVPNSIALGSGGSTTVQGGAPPIAPVMPVTPVAPGKPVSSHYPPGVFDPGTSNGRGTHADIGTAPGHGVFTDVLAEGGQPSNSSEAPMMAGGMGQGFGRVANEDSGPGRRSSRITRGNYFGSEVRDWELPRPSSVYEGATDQYGNPIEAYKPAWQRIREAAQKARHDRSELEGPS